MNKKLYFIIPLMFSSGLFAQGIYNNGGKIVIGSGAYVCINGTGGNYRNETNVSDGAIALTGTLKLDGNYTNNVSASDILVTPAPGSIVALTGTTPQTLGGSTTIPFTFSNLTVNNSSGVILANSAQVNGALTLTSGLVNIGISNLTMGLAATIAGTPSASAMVIATGTGQVRKLFNSPGSFTFPVGDNSGLAEYSPVALTFTSGTFAAGAYTGVNLVNAAYPDPYITGSYLNRYWNIAQSGITGFACNAAFNYVPADVVGTESNIYCIRIIPAPITIFDPANTVLHQLTASGLTSFGTYTGALGLKYLNLTSVLLQGLYISSGTMRQASDGFGPHWPAGVADHIAVELHNAISYASIVNSTPDVPLSTTGTASLTVPATLSGSYYITIKHRNSVETTTAAAVSFAGGTINQSFGAPANVFGGNLALSSDSHYLIYAGDVTSGSTPYPAAPVKDGVVDLVDDYYVYASFLNGDFGYLPGDVNGDGVVDLLDAYMVYTNFLLGIYAITP